MPEMARSIESEYASQGKMTPTNSLYSATPELLQLLNSFFLLRLP